MTGELGQLALCFALALSLVIGLFSLRVKAMFYAMITLGRLRLPDARLAVVRTDRR